MSAPVHPLVWHLADTGKIASPAHSLPLLKAAVAVAPDRTDLKRQLARLLFRADRMQEVVDWLRPVMNSEDGDPELLNYLGRAALAAGDWQTAVHALRLAAAKDFVGSIGWLATALARSQCSDEAIETAFQALKDPTPDFRPLALLARLLPQRGETERLWTLCVELRARGYWGGYLPAATAFAAAATRRMDEIASLINPTRWFSAGHLEISKGFNESLSTEMLTNRELSSVHSSKATRGNGVWIDHLQVFGGTLAKKLLAEIRLAVQDYVAQRELFVDDPMIAHRPERVGLNSWAAVVQGDGYQKWHIHPDGWISGVYYVDVPELKRGNDAGAGDIEFGPYSFGNMLENVDTLCWRITPKAGLLLLFPSHYAHRTWPTMVNDRRSSIAFDVLPSREARQA
jgi:putative 2-oxoglutarate-Fe(II)-dependent oxygenase superfamily protein